MVLEPDAVQSGCNSAELNAFSASGVENGGDSFAKDVLTLVVDWRIQTNFGVLDESNLADLVAESVDGSEGQQYEDLDADILRTGGVNAAGNHLQSSAQTDSFNDVDLDARANAETLSMPLQLPKPIWDDVVWEAITGTLMTVDQLVPPCSRPAFPYTRVLVESAGGFQQSLEAESGNSSVRATRMWCGIFPIKDWQEERESLLQSALKRWLVTVISFLSRPSFGNKFQWKAKM